MEAIKERYGAERKEVEGLKERAATMAGAMAAFCERMGYKDLEVLISRFQVSASLDNAQLDVMPCGRRWLKGHSDLEVLSSAPKSATPCSEAQGPSGNPLRSVLH